MTPVRLEPVALQSRVKHSTTEPLLSLVDVFVLNIAINIVFSHITAVSHHIAVFFFSFCSKVFYHYLVYAYYYIHIFVCKT